MILKSLRCWTRNAIDAEAERVSKNNIELIASGVASKAVMAAHKELSD